MENISGTFWCWNMSGTSDAHWILNSFVWNNTSEPCMNVNLIIHMSLKHAELLLVQFGQMQHSKCPSDDSFVNGSNVTYTLPHQSIRLHSPYNLLFGIRVGFMACKRNYIRVLPKTSRDTPHHLYGGANVTIMRTWMHVWMLGRKFTFLHVHGRHKLSDGVSIELLNHRLTKEL